MIILSSAEASEALGTITSAISSAIQMNTFLVNNTTCTPSQFIGNVDIDFNLKEDLVYNLGIIEEEMFPIDAIMFILLLSFLTEYLSKRYLHHSYTKSVFKHLTIFFIQMSIILVLSNTVVHILNLTISPILVLIDWCILVANSRKLRNVLKSNVRDLNLHFRNRYLYRQQLKHLQIYSVYMPILLAALFFGVLAISFTCYSQSLQLILISTCLYPAGFNEVLYLSRYGTLIMISIHFILLGLPLYAVSIQMFVSACLKRIRSREEHYRFNYSNFPNIPGFK